MKHNIKTNILSDITVPAHVQKFTGGRPPLEMIAMMR